jgi:hypothetical protein
MLMQKLLYAAGTSFLRAFGVTFLFAATGLLSAPDFSTARALSWAALAASLAAGLRAVQVFIPQFSFGSFVTSPVLAAWLDAAVRAGAAAFVTGVTGWLAAPDLHTWRAAWLAIFIGAATAAVRALQGLVTPGEQPQTSKGLAA